MWVVRERGAGGGGGGGGGGGYLPGVGVSTCLKVSNNLVSPPPTPPEKQDQLWQLEKHPVDET